jgi:hypothetical protein
MPFRLPTLNLTVRIFTGPGGAPPPVAVPVGPKRLETSCQLTYGRRVNVASTGGTAAPGIPVQAMSLLIAKLTDIRGLQDTVSYDIVEVPSGSNRWYWVSCVDDIAKGFANEHRSAVIFPILGTWTAPYN